MRREVLAKLVVMVLSAAPVARAADAGGAARAADAGSRSAIAADAGASASDAQADLPPGHPTIAAHPHGGDPMDDMFAGLPDVADEDPSLPAGTIDVELRDENDKPLPSFGLTLAILKQSVAKGEGREHRPVVTSSAGKARFDGLAVGSEQAYRVSSIRDGASYGARPFNLPMDKGMKVVLHVYPATGDINVARIVFQGVLYVDLKDDRLQVQQLLTVMNFGKVSFVPKDLILPLPSDFTALRSMQQMSDIGVDAVEGKGARLRGSFGPGRNDLEFSWQVPYHGSDRVDLTVGMPPHLAVLRVMAVAAPQMRLDVEGFPAAQQNRDHQGLAVLVTQREATKEDADLSVARIHLTNIPTQGSAPLLVTLLSGGTLALGIALAARQRRHRSSDDPRAERKRLLAELSALERAHAEGDVGPKTYERARQEIVDAIARTFAEPSG